MTQRPVLKAVTAYHAAQRQVRVLIYFEDRHILTGHNLSPQTWALVKNMLTFCAPQFNYTFTVVEKNSTVETPTT